MDVTIIPTEEIGRVWPKAFVYILKSVNASGKREDMNTVLNELMTSVTTLWVAIDDDFVIRSSATLKKIIYPERICVMRVCHIGGEQGIRWFNPMYEKFTSYARDNQCDYLEAECIPRWESFMKRYGAEELSRIYRLPVPELKGV